MKRNPKFYTAAGRLTRYSLACGYQEMGFSEKDGVRKTVRLFMDGSVIHVTAYQCKDGIPSMEEFCTQNMVTARRVFSAKLKQYGLKIQKPPEIPTQ